MVSLQSHTAEKVLKRLGFAAPPPLTLDGLNDLYRAWCRTVPFDNARKRLALATGAPGPLPGGGAQDFLSYWLEHGAGGTCWPSSNALHGLLVTCGFDARRVAAAMYELEEPNHGSVIVDLAGREFLVDSSMLTDQAFALRPGERFEIDDPVHPMVAEPVEGSWRFRFGVTLSTDTMVCRMRQDPVDEPFYLDYYERSRQLSPFNASLYARRNGSRQVVTFAGSTRFEKIPAGVTSASLGPAELAAALIDEIGYSAELAAQLAAHGLLC